MSSPALANHSVLCRNRKYMNRNVVGRFALEHSIICLAPLPVQYWKPQLRYRLSWPQYRPVAEGGSLRYRRYLAAAVAKKPPALSHLDPADGQNLCHLVLGWLGINEFVKKHPSCRPDLVLEQEHGNYRSCHGTPWHAFADPVAPDCEYH